MRITRRLEFDAGHRIPNHQSQCRHLHGHRYALEITLAGGVIYAPGPPAPGIVMEFFEVNAIWNYFYGNARLESLPQLPQALTICHHRR